MAVIPLEIDGIFADGMGGIGLYRWLVHRQQGCGFGRRFTRLAILVLALLFAGGTRAGITQPLERIMRLMTVLPFNVHTRTGRDIDLDGPGICESHIFQYRT